MLVMRKAKPIPTNMSRDNNNNNEKKPRKETKGSKISIEQLSEIKRINSNLLNTMREYIESLGKMKFYGTELECIKRDMEKIVEEETTGESDTEDEIIIDCCNHIDMINSCLNTYTYNENGKNEICDNIGKLSSIYEKKKLDDEILLSQHQIEEVKKKHRNERTPVLDMPDINKIRDDSQVSWSNFGSEESQNI